MMANFIPENIEILLSKYKFDVNSDCLNEGLTCTICKKLLHDAYQSICDCKYCRECIVSYMIDGNEYCPGGKEECREELLVLDKSVFPNVALNKKILKIKVRCPNETCNSSFILAKMEDHLRVCSYQPIECPYTKIGCANASVNRDSVETHLIRETLGHSQMLMEVIDNLKNEVGGLKEELRANKLEIAFLREECKLKREMREEESMVGLEEKVALTAVVEELQDEVAALKGHLKFSEEFQQRLTEVEDEVRALREDILTEKEKSIKLMGEVETLKMENGIIKEELIIMKLRGEIESEESFKTRGEMEVLQREIKTINGAIVRLDGMKKEEANIYTMFIELKNLVYLLNMWMIKGVAVESLWFTVDGIKNMIKKESTFDSPILYSHINGYKLHIQVSTSGGYIFLYSVICKGEHDDELSWPASGLSISVSLINHHTMEANKTKTITYDSQFDTKYCSKPDGKNNPPCGGLTLVNHSYLVCTSDLIKSDSILLRVKVTLPT